MSEEARRPVGSEPSCRKRVVLVGRYNDASRLPHGLLPPLAWVRYQTYWGILVAWQHAARFLILQGLAGAELPIKKSCPCHRVCREFPATSNHSRYPHIVSKLLVSCMQRYFISFLYALFHQFRTKRLRFSRRFLLFLHCCWYRSQFLSLEHFARASCYSVTPFLRYSVTPLAYYSVSLRGKAAN